MTLPQVKDTAKRAISPHARLPAMGHPGPLPCDAREAWETGKPRKREPVIVFPVSNASSVPKAPLRKVAHALAALLFGSMTLALAASAAATPIEHGVREDASTYPPGVSRVMRSFFLLAGGEFNVTVNLDRSLENATLFLCGFARVNDTEPRVCWTPIAAKPVEGADGMAFVADSADGPHPSWKAGEVVGYKLLLSGGGNETRVPADGSYYKVVVESPAGLDTRGAGGVCLLCLAGLGVAVTVRRRWKTV